MISILPDLILCGILYVILIAFIFMKNKKRNNNDEDNDEDGGLPVYSPPEIDLPPGVTLPDGDPVKKVPEEILV